MNTETDIILKKSIEQFGIALLKDPKMFIAVLSDRNVSRKEINMLACVIKVSFFSDFLNNDLSNRTQQLTNKLIAEVQREYPYSEMQIRDAIKSINYAIGIGISSNNDIDKSNIDNASNSKTEYESINIAVKEPPNILFQRKYKDGLSQYMKHTKKQENIGAYKGQTSVSIKEATVSEELSYAFDICKEAAENGDSISQNNLGVMYQEGIGVAKDYKTAVKWYKIAADRGNMHSQQNLGWMYRNGFGVPQDCVKAMKYYIMAAEQGHLLANNNIGWLYQNGYGTNVDYTKAFLYYKTGAEKGEPYSQTNLGFMYEKGLGVEKDFFEAVKWYRLAVEQKNEQAYNNLGYMYERGFGVITNFEESAVFYRKSAELGFIVGQINIARAYSIGLGVKKNYELVDKWVNSYRKAADPVAIRICAWCFVNGCGIHENVDEAFKWYSIAAELNDADSQYNLGLLYYKRNKAAIAAKWFKRASFLGNIDAKTMLYKVQV